MKRLMTIILICFLIVTVFGLTRQIILALKASSRIDLAADNYNKLLSENTRLKKRLGEVTQDDFIEQQAREKLNLARPNETVVIIPQDQIDQIAQLYRKTEAQPLPNWQKWLNLIIR